MLFAETALSWHKSKSATIKMMTTLTLALRIARRRHVETTTSTMKRMGVKNNVTTEMMITLMIA